MNHRPVRYAGLLLAAAISSHVQAQQNQTTQAPADASASEQAAVQLDTITVTTGSRTAKAVDKIPGAVTVISAAEETSHE